MAIITSINPSVSVNVVIFNELFKGALRDKKLLSNPYAFFKFSSSYVATNGRDAAAENLGDLFCCQQFILHFLPLKFHMIQESTGLMSSGDLDR